MDSLSDSARRILEIEARQDEALKQLEALERQIEQVLAEHLPGALTAPRQSPVSPDKAA